MDDVATAFRRLMLRIQPLQRELALAASHAASVRSRLEASFRLKKFVLVGSHARDTAIRWYSDVDHFAVFSRDDFRRGDDYKSSNTVLDNLRTDLAARFWQTPVNRDGPAIVINFGQGDYSVDVVPAMFWEMNPKKWPIYYMPDGSGGWLRTSPEYHNKFIRDANIRSGGKLKRTVQFVKYRRECRRPRVPLSSFHLDLMVADQRICEGAKSYALCLADTFRALSRRRCGPYQDPLGVCGNVGAVKSDTQREVTLRAVTYALEHAQTAIEADRTNGVSEAVRHWDIVFNGNFAA